MVGVGSAAGRSVGVGVMVSSGIAVGGLVGEAVLVAACTVGGTLVSAMSEIGGPHAIPASSSEPNMITRNGFKPVHLDFSSNHDQRDT